MLNGYFSRREQLRAWANHDALIFGNFKETAEHITGRPLSALRILDLGCGSNAPMTLMLHAAGSQVTGVDHMIGTAGGSASVQAATSTTGARPASPGR